MSDILVYVNESSSCCVIAENTDATLESFRHEMKAQVDDVLWFPFKFTRLVCGKRVTVGAKQEAVIKLKQCIEGTGEPAIYLIRDEISTAASSPITVEASTSRDADTEKKDFDSPPPKKSKLSQQPTLFDLLSPGRSMDKKSQDPYSAARARKIKIYSNAEIANSSGMTKVYREFWNAKGEELCRSSALNNFKPGEIHGAINVSWTLEKCKLIKDDVNKIQNEIKQECPVHLLKKFKLSKVTLDNDIARVEENETSLRQLQKELTCARTQLIDSETKSARKDAGTRVEDIENELDSKLAELKRSQESLRKAIRTRQKLLDTLDANRNGSPSSPDSLGDENSSVEESYSGDEE